MGKLTAVKALRDRWVADGHLHDEGPCNCMVCSLTRAIADDEHGALNERVGQPQGFESGLEAAARWCEQQTGDFAQFFTAESAAKAIRALDAGKPVKAERTRATRGAAMDFDGELEYLKDLAGKPSAELSKGEIDWPPAAPQTEPVDPLGDASWWRAQYENLLASVNTAHPPAAPELRALTAAEAVEEYKKSLDVPELEDFAKGVLIEAQHQRQRWGDDHDTSKEPEEWFWVIGYLAGKGLRAQRDSDYGKFKHHLITGAALLANWHARAKAALAGPEQGREGK